MDVDDPFLASGAVADFRAARNDRPAKAASFKASAEHLLKARKIGPRKLPLREFREIDCNYSTLIRLFGQLQELAGEPTPVVTSAKRTNREAAHNGTAAAALEASNDATE